jgi:SAM-dependent methyltransferase
MDWTKLTSDPLKDDVCSAIRTYLRSISGLYSGGLVDLFCLVAKDSEVLHIGCYEHDINYLQSDNWKHRKIYKASKDCIGLDINKKGVEEVKKLGMPAVCCDATSNNYIGRLFDVIISGDVIEHVDNIGNFIDFNVRHILPNGVIYISTPNPFFIGFVRNAWTGGPMIANFEHTAWISESNMLEICRRKNLKLEKIIYPTGTSNANPIIRMIKKISFRMRSTSLFTSIVYVVRL